VYITERLSRLKMDSLRNGIVRLSWNLQVYKQLLPLGIDILNYHSKAPIKFIIKLSFRGSGHFLNLWVWRIIKFQACVLRMSRRACGRYRWDTLKSWGVCILDTPTVILHKDTETSSSSWHHQETLQMSIYSQLTTPKAFTRKMVVESNFKNWNVNQLQTKCLNCTVEHITTFVCTSPTIIDR